MYPELTTYIRATFKTSGELTGYLNAYIWPLYRADSMAISAEQREALRTQRLAEKAALERIRTEEQAKRAEARKQSRRGAMGPPNERFCDLDDSPLSDRQVMIRATHGTPVKEKATGRIMRFSEMTGYKKGTGKWVDVEKYS